MQSENVTRIKVSVPTMGQKKMDEVVSPHFGRAPTFTIVDTEKNSVVVVQKTSEHMGGVGKPPEIMKKNGVDVMLCSGIGPRAIKMFEQYGIEILTDDWSKYDANRPVTRTDGCSPEDVTALLHRYYRGLRLTPEALEGIKSEAEEEERALRRAPLAWALLREDVIESLGTMKRDGSPVDGLVNKLTQIVTYSHSEVTESVSKWVEKRLLKYEVQGENLTWKWS